MTEDDEAYTGRPYLSGRGDRQHAIMSRRGMRRGSPWRTLGEGELSAALGVVTRFRQDDRRAARLEIARGQVW